jgi:hypothetical protein
MVALSSLGGAGWQFFDSNGTPLAGGKLYTYAAGTTTPAVTYTTSAGTPGTENTNPIILDSAGRVTAQVWLENGDIYKFALETSTGIPLWTKDNIPGIFADSILNATSVEYDPPFTGALTSGYTVADKLAQTVSVLDFGAVGNGVTDDTAAFNLATAAASAFSTNNYRGVHVPAGFYRLGAGNTFVTVRKGQTLSGEGFGATTIDASATGTNTVPTFRAANAGDVASGYPVEFANMLILGGPSGFANIEFSGFAGWKARDIFFSAPGIGITAGGGDGQVQNCIFDLGLNHIIVSGGNLLLSGNIHYLGSYHVTFGTACYDTTLSACQFEYFEYAGILISGGVGPKNIAVNGSNFIQNGQYATTQGAIFIISNNAEFTVSDCRFRNINGFGIKYSNGIGNTMIVDDCVFDQEKTLPIYDQGVNMGGIDCTNMQATISGCTFRNMQDNSILVGGAEIINVIIEACSFSNCVGGAADIVVTNSNPASRVYIKGCHSSRVLVSNTGSAVVSVIGCTDSSPTTVASAAAFPIGKTKDLFFVTGTTTITSILSDAGDAGRVITLLFQGAVTVTNSANLQLAGSVNFVSTANDTLTLFTIDGTAWYEQSRTLI